jgi:actin beta/gamma 1
MAANTTTRGPSGASKSLSSGDCAVVVDCGSSELRVGVSGEEAPRERRARDDGDRRPYPVPQWDLLEDDGVWRCDWDVLGDVLAEDVLPQLGVDFQRGLLLTEPPNLPAAEREKCTTVAFETLRTPAVHLAVAPLLSLLAAGKTTGTVVDVGERFATTLCCLEGSVLPHTVRSQAGLGGQALSAFLLKLATERGYAFAGASFERPEDLALFRRIKEQVGYVAQDFDEMMWAAEAGGGYTRRGNEIPFPYAEEEFTLPDGNVLTFGNERFRCGEALFQPCFVGKEDEGIHESAYCSLMSVDHDVRRQMWAVVLSGGSTLFPGLDERLKKEMYCLAPGNVNTNSLSSAPSRPCSAWVGGSLMASASSFGQTGVSREEYEESGPSAIRMCF